MNLWGGQKQWVPRRTYFFSWPSFPGSDAQSLSLCTPQVSEQPPAPCAPPRRWERVRRTAPRRWREPSAFRCPPAHSCRPPQTRPRFHDHPLNSCVGVRSGPTAESPWRLQLPWFSRALHLANPPAPLNMSHQMDSWGTHLSWIKHMRIFPEVSPPPCGERARKLLF